VHKAALSGRRASAPAAVSVPGEAAATPGPSGSGSEPQGSGPRAHSGGLRMGGVLPGKRRGGHRKRRCAQRRLILSTNVLHVCLRAGTGADEASPRKRARLRGEAQAPPAAPAPVPAPAPAPASSAAPPRPPGSEGSTGSSPEDAGPAAGPGAAPAAPAARAAAAGGRPGPDPGPDEGTRAEDTPTSAPRPAPEERAGAAPPSRLGEPGCPDGSSAVRQAGRGADSAGARESLAASETGGSVPGRPLARDADDGRPRGAAGPSSQGSVARAPPVPAESDAAGGAQGCNAGGSTNGAAARAADAGDAPEPDTSCSIAADAPGRHSTAAGTPVKPGHQRAECPDTPLHGGAGDPEPACGLAGEAGGRHAPAAGGCAGLEGEAAGLRTPPAGLRRPAGLEAPSAVRDQMLRELLRVTRG